MICPRCDGQGLIYKGHLIDLDTYLYICDECEACWLPEEKIELTKFKDLTTFLEANGLTYEKSELKNLGYLEESLK